MSRPARALAVALLVAAPATLVAHPLAPVLLDVREEADGVVRVAWKTPLLRPRGPVAAPVLPAGCTTVDPPAGAVEGAGVVTRWTARCGPLVGQRLGIEGLAGPLTGVVRIGLADGRVVQSVVSAPGELVLVPPRPRRRDVVASYLRLGVEHILAGPDHLLFVAGLVLLARTARRILATVTAFTAGHSVTLSLAALDLARVPQDAVELAIAASVLVLAVEVARDRDGDTVAGRRPWALAFGFGLLHGLGFASALREAGLPAGEVPLALLAFNTGIELGQVAFVAVVLAAWRVLGPLASIGPAWVRRVPSYAIGIAAAFWCFERAAAWWE